MFKLPVRKEVTDYGYGLYDADNIGRAYFLAKSDADHLVTVLNNWERVEDLVILTKRLASALKKYNPDSDLPNLAMDYLFKYGFSQASDILKEIDNEQD